jgi:phosphoglycolate phosphatase-like HAD superfamily hydrolase
MGIVTGNIRSTAYLKLSRFGLDRFFKTGGFGDFTISRSLLAKDAIHQSGNYFRKDFSNDQIILFGDTQKDIQSAIDNEIRGVLIDHDESKADESRIWGAHCRGNFADFNSLLKFLI